MSLGVLMQGFGLGFSMIIPIGAQNTYVLNQGIKRNHHLITATICSFIDLFFISTGIFGGGALLARHEAVLVTITLGGIAFLTFYGILSIESAINAYKNTEIRQPLIEHGYKAVILGTLAVTLLNPHLYLDTMVILGSIGGQFEEKERISFATGTIMASFIWFYSLSIGAAKLASTLSKPRVKQGIDIAVALMMFTIAFLLAKELFIKYY